MFFNARLSRLTNLLLFAMFLSSLYLTRAYGLYKLPLLVLCLFFVSIKLLTITKFKLDVYGVIPIFSVVVGAILWSSLGLLKGNSSEAIVDTLRLFVAFYLIYFVIIIYASRYILYSDIELLFSIATILISVTTIMSVLDVNLFPLSFQEQLNLRVGIHDGYIQNTSHHIGMLALTVPYLLTLIVYNDASYTKLVRLSAVLGVVAIFLSSRRAIYVVLSLLPLIIFFLHIVSVKNLNERAKRLFSFFLIYFFVLIVAFFLFYTFYPSAFGFFMDRLWDAYNQFGSESIYLSERKIQSDALIGSISNSPFLGDGFGATTSSVRNEKGWLYELSYHALVLNIGLFGFSVFAIFLMVQFFRIIFFIKKFNIKYKFHCIALMTGVIGMYIISYSNPYISSSFDFLLVNFVLPFIIFKERNTLYEG